MATDVIPADMYKRRCTDLPLKCRWRGEAEGNENRGPVSRQQELLHDGGEAEVRDKEGWGVAEVDGCGVRK